MPKVKERNIFNHNPYAIFYCYSRKAKKGGEGKNMVF